MPMLLSMGHHLAVKGLFPLIVGWSLKNVHLPVGNQTWLARKIQHLLRWFSHLSRLWKPSFIGCPRVPCLMTPMGMMYCELPSTRWHGYVSLGCSPWVGNLMLGSSCSVKFLGENCRFLPNISKTPFHPRVNLSIVPLKLLRNGVYPILIPHFLDKTMLILGIFGCYRSSGLPGSPRSNSMTFNSTFNQTRTTDSKRGASQKVVWLVATKEKRDFNIFQ